MKRFLSILGIIAILLIVGTISVLANTNISKVKEIDVSQINSPEECIEILQEIAIKELTNEEDINKNYENEQKVKQRLIELSNNTTFFKSSNEVNREETLEQIEDKIAAYTIVKMTFELDNNKEKVNEYEKYIEEANQLIKDVERNENLVNVQQKLQKLK